MLGLLRRILFSKWAILAGLAVVGWQAWTVLRPRPWEPDPLQKQVADTVCWEAAESIPEGLTGIDKVAVLPLAGHDDDLYVTEKLAQCLHGKGRYKVPRETFLGNLRKELKLPEKRVATPAEAVKIGKSLGVSGVVFGQVSKLTRERDSAEIGLKLSLARVDAETVVWDKAFTQKASDASAIVKPATDAGPLTKARYSIRTTAIVKRLLIWLAFAALVPLLCIPVIKHFLERESNAVNFAILAALTLADLAAAYVLCGLAVFSWLAGVMLVAAGAAGGAYNYWLCSTIERLRR